MRSSAPRSSRAGSRPLRLDRAAERRPHRRNGQPAAPAPRRTAAPEAPAPAAATPETPPAPSRKRRRLLLLVPILAVVGLLGLYFGLRFWYESTYFVMTDNAQVTGDLVQVGSLNAGRVVEASLEVGQ